MYTYSRWLIQYLRNVAMSTIHYLRVLIKVTWIGYVFDLFEQTRRHIHSAVLLRQSVIRDFTTTHCVSTGWKRAKRREDVQEYTNHISWNLHLVSAPLQWKQTAQIWRIVSNWIVCWVPRASEAERPRKSGYVRSALNHSASLHSIRLIASASVEISPPPLLTLIIASIKMQLYAEIKQNITNNSLPNKNLVSLNLCSSYWTHKRNQTSNII